MIDKGSTDTRKQQNELKAARTSTGGLVLWLWLFFPVGLYKLWREKHFNLPKRIAITALILVSIHYVLPDAKQTTHEAGYTSNNLPQKAKPSNTPMSAANKVESKPAVKQAPEPYSRYRIDIKSEVKGSHRVEVDIATNLPDYGRLHVDMTPEMLGENELFAVGHRKVTVTNGKASVEYILSENPEFVDGRYDIKVGFYPKLTANKDYAARLGIDEPIVTFDRVALSGLPSWPRDASGKQPHETEAHAACKMFVSQKVDRPDFPFGNRVIDLIGDNTFKVSSYVEHHNPYGAEIRSDYVCVTKFTDRKEWLIVDLSFH